MTARILDGAALARQIRSEMGQRAGVLASRGHQPGLAVILVGDDPASSVYVKHKVTDCHEAGIRSILDHLPADTSESMLLARIHDLNNDPAVHGILVQMPLPPHLNPQRVIEAISPLKDVDCFHVSNVGALMTGEPRFMPCTPYGVMKLLEHAGVPLAGAHAVVVGRSNIVGKPQAMLLLQASATVTICHSKTQDLAEHCRRADILVAAVGRAQMITGDMIKPGAVVIDVGMNRVPSGPRAGKLCGDVDFDSAALVAGAITPVPGGVGPMTRAMLLVNTVEAADRAAGADQNR